ncbi:MAG: T9SS C-terminal target domain-containing protein [Bacteroidales bacterium]|nr:MAG: T9SS C-terminal target domain-containing protein [Bacteroidales bacterium]
MKKIFTLILSLALMQAFGQTSPILMQVVASAGGSFSSASLKVDWTLGESVIGNLPGTGVIVTQGFQQGNLLGTGVPTEPEFASTNFNLFPNPAINMVYFKIDNKEAKGTFIVDVFDITGRKLLSNNLGQFNNQETMDMNISSLKSGIYLVKVRIGNFSSDVIKLIKE